MPPFQNRSTGGWINTDAIDNSAGVDTSDHEVNIKILLNQVVADGDLTVKQRNALLAEMTDEVGHLVLRNNYAQNVVLANAVAQAASMVNVHSRMINRLEANGQLDRALEYLPTEKQIRDRQQAGRGLSQPELSVLLAYTKITLADELLATDLPDDPYFRDVLHAYFPSALRARFAEQIDHHPLRREIITTLIVNDTINRGGCTFAFRLREETGATMEEIARTHAAARAVFGLEQIWDQVERLDNKVAAGVQTKMRLHARRLVERATRWMLNNRQPLDIADTIAFFHDRVNQVWDALPKPLTGEDLAWFESVHRELSAAGVPDELATRIAGLSSAFPTLDIVGVADRSDTGVMEVAELYYDLGDRLQISHLLDRVIDLPRTDRWSSMARAAIREDLFAAHAALTADVLAAGPAGSSPEERYSAWAELNGTLLSRARTTLDDIRGSDHYELSSLSVAMRVIRTLLRNGR